MKTVKLLCAAGTSTQILAQKVQETADNLGLEMDVKAASVSGSDDACKDADLLLPQGFTWQGALLGRIAGGRLHMAPRLRCLLPAVPDPAHSLVLDDISDITALLSGQSRQTGLAGNEAALWWRDLPLARMMLKQGRATLSFN